MLSSSAVMTFFPSNCSTMDKVAPPIPVEFGLSGLGSDSGGFIWFGYVVTVKVVGNGEVSCVAFAVILELPEFLPEPAPPFVASKLLS